MWQDEVDYLGAYVYILITIIHISNTYIILQTKNTQLSPSQPPPTSTITLHLHQPSPSTTVINHHCPPPHLPQNRSLSFYPLYIYISLLWSHNRQFTNNSSVHSKATQS
ncbi:hypothetical protein Hanom_Chr10g00961631 [Helianthus anomalus]